MLVSRQLGHDILRGITRQGLAGLARDMGMVFEERPFTPAQARRAAEAFLTSSSGFLMPVTAIDGHLLGDGTPGPVTRRLLAAYWRAVARQTGVDHYSGG
ncbi:MAG: hypothetical protein D6782_09790 [Alphaproteobacteria bacterium]|nr:MAG: hypothetical protein D6782_09790 [Alphaproteobacteria bacterium]